MIGSANSTWRQIAIATFSLLALGVVWELIVRVFEVPRFLLPVPSDVLIEVATDWKFLAENAAYTLEETLAGFFGAVLVGVVLAILIVQFKPIEKVLYTILVALNSIPKVAVAPLFIVWLGTGLEPKIAIAAMIAVFAIVIDLVHGLQSTDPEMIDLGHALRGSNAKIMFKIRFPHALPSLFAGMKVGVSLALIGAIVGEFVAAKRGLGYVIMVAQGQFDITRMFAAIFILAAIGTLLFFSLDFAERILLPWHVSRRRGAPVIPQP